MTSNAAALQHLHHAHEVLGELRARLARGPAQVRATEAKCARETEQLTQLKDQVKRVKLNAAERELQLKERENRILDIRAKLNSCSSNKEYQALIERIAADEQANSVLSDEILDLYEKIGGLEKQVAVHDSQLAKCQQDLLAIRQRVEAERVQLEEEITRAESVLVEAESILPAEIRQPYQRVVKAHGQEALAAVEDEVCGGCFQKVTPQMLNELGMSHFIFCKSCGRLLYLPAADR